MTTRDRVAARPRPAGRLRHWCRRKPAVAAVTVLTAVALAGVVTLGVVFMLAQARARREAQQILAWAALERGRGLADRGDAGDALLWFARAVEEAPADDADLQRVARATLAGWAATQPHLRHVLPHPCAVASVAFSPDGRTLATGTDRCVRFWDPLTGRPRGDPLTGPTKQKLIDTFNVSLNERFAFTPDGRELLAWNLLARRWDVTTGRPLGEALANGTGMVLAAAVSPDGRTLATASGVPLIGGQPGEVRLWDVDGRPRATLPHPGSVFAVTFTPDGQTLITGDETGVRLFAAATGAPVGEPLPHGQPVRGLAVTPDGRWLLVGTSDATAGDGEARAWDLTTHKPVGGPLTTGAGVLTVAIAPDGRRCAVSTSGLGVRLFDAATGREAGDVLRHQAAVDAVTFTPDGRWVVTASRDGTARVWDAATGRPTSPPLWHGRAVNAVAIGSDGASLATAGDDGTVRLWDLHPPRLLAHPKAVRAVKFTSDGRQLLTTDGAGTTRLWNVEGSQPVDGPPLDGTTAVSDLPPFDGRGRVVALSPDGRRYATIIDDGPKVTSRSVWLRDAATGEPAGEPLALDETVTAVRFSPDGRHLAAGGKDGAARVWDLATRREVASLTHPGGVLCLAFSPDGRWLLTGGPDPFARVWDVPTGQPITALPHGGTVSAAGWTEDGRTIATGSIDGLGRLWPAPVATAGDTGRLAAWVRVLTGRELVSGGGVRTLDATGWTTVRQRLAQLGGPPVHP